MAFLHYDHWLNNYQDNFTIDGRQIYVYAQEKNLKNKKID